MRFKLQILFYAVVSGFLVCCGEPLIQESYTFIMPALPDDWEATLGQPSWHLEWATSNGDIVQAETNEQVYQNADLMQGWQSAVIAYPYWPEVELSAGIMKPAGALFPHDAQHGKLMLSWRGGIDANFYRKLAAKANEKRLPYDFDWYRFRELFSEKTLAEEICNNPWLADWNLIAEKTASGGFDKRRIVPAARTNIAVIIPHDGPWVGSSPFMARPDWKTGETVAIPVTDITDSYFCSAGALHCVEKIWLWHPNSDI